MLRSSPLFLRSILSLVVLGSVLSIAACAKKEESTETAMPPAETMAPAVSDAQIAAIVLAANETDIKAGEMAEGMTKNAEVKAFAKQMVTDHTSVNQQAKDLAGKLSLTPEENATSQMLKTNGDAVRDSLKTKEGAAFDKAYIDNEVAYHQAVLEAMDSTLIPNAQNAELKALLQSVRPAFVAHLEHAQKIQGTLK